jgi:2-polyprenyl-3-methyl-5-hydroxy-6-metoxy-1,4-benzoquinol methylase
MSQREAAAMDDLAPDPRAAAELYGLAVRAVTGDAQRGAPCIACGATSARPRYVVAEVAAPVVVCEGCGLGRFEPLPSPEVVASFYPDRYYGDPGRKFRHGIEQLVRWTGERHVDFLSRGLPPGARVLDVGCGRGVVLGRLADRGFEVHGVEFSAAAMRGADPRAELRVAPRLADAGYPAASFDQVLIWHVLEHLAEPRETLREVQRILRPGGRLVVAVPNFASLQARWSDAAWFHLDLPRHLHHFPLAALRRLLDETGFEPVSDHHFSLRQNPFGWIQSALNRVASLPRNGLYALLHHAGNGRPPPFEPRVRWALVAAGALLAPFALAASVLDALRDDGATVHVVALRRPDGAALRRPDGAAARRSDVAAPRGSDARPGPPDA